MSLLNEDIHCHQVNINAVLVKNFSYSNSYFTVLLVIVTEYFPILVIAIASF